MVDLEFYVGDVGFAVCVGTKHKKYPSLFPKQCSILEDMMTIIIFKFLDNFLKFIALKDFGHMDGDLTHYGRWPCMEEIWTKADPQCQIFKVPIITTLKSFLNSTTNKALRLNYTLHPCNFT